MTALDPGLDPGLDHADAVALLARQTGILEQIATGGALSGVLTGIATTLEDLVPGCRCSVLLLDPRTATLHHGAAPSLPAEYSAGIDGLPIGADAGSCGTAAYTGRAVVAADIREDARWQRYLPLAERFGLRACWSTPIRGRDGVTGTFAVYHLSPHRPTPREEHLVQRLTHLASVAIDHDGLLGALTESEERFRRAFEDNAVGMALAALDGGVTRVNRAMRTLLGRSEFELIGSRLDELFTRGSGPETDRYDAAQYDAAQYEAAATTPDGRVLDLAVAVSPIRGAGGAPRALSVNVLDITGRRAAERERRRRREAELAQCAAEASNRAKSDFLSALAHELRTPLQAITGFTELLATLDLDGDRRAAALGHIDAAADHILAMVNDVLDVARIEANALPLTPADVVLEPVVADVLAMLEPLATAERVPLRAAAPAAPVRVRADERRVRQVLLNLVANAIRYNRPDGTVVVGWAARGQRARITVRDTGPGIAAEHLDRLFTPFDRLGADRDEGVGLGLPLARGLTEAMGGTLDVRSEVGAGTTVTVALPLA
ncbi:ATP-binding protein [Pseudonocardia lacus]|uniref:ATP-binding protein n=1 Tax=Pseudonocardia lacus TaxID=2835865 RepID=UPI001BDD3BAC|nr:ATP-binding protein [Pseudonocardia lacus]